MPRYIDFAPKRPRSAVSARPVMSKKVEKSTSRPALEPTPEPASKPATKPVVKTVKKTTVTVATGATPRRRPVVAPRGLRIDFARPATHPVVHRTPTSRPAVTPHHAPTSTSINVKTTKPVRPIKPAKPASSARPTKPVKPAEPESRSIKVSGVPLRAPKPIQPTRSAQPALKPAPKSIPKPTPKPEDFNDFAGFDDVEPMMSDDDLTLALAGFADDESTPVLTDNLSKEVSDFNEELDALDELDILADDIENQLSGRLEAEAEEFVEEPKPLFDSAPKKKSFIPLGDRSRFLASVSVEKRPLSSTSSASTADTKKSAPVKPTKSIKPSMSIKSIKPTPAKRRAPVISTPQPKAHSFAMTLAIILTIILGAGLGAIVYLAFFQE